MKVSWWDRCYFDNLDNFRTIDDFCEHFKGDKKVSLSPLYSTVSPGALYLFQNYTIKYLLISRIEWIICTHNPLLWIIIQNLCFSVWGTVRACHKWIPFIYTQNVHVGMLIFWRWLRFVSFSIKPLKIKLEQVFTT